MTNWTKQDIPNQTDKVFVITGANSGLGFESTLALAEKGATIVMACRSLERGQRATEKIKQTIPAAKLDLMELDLASLKSIHAFADAFKNKYDRLDVLLNNGGPVGADRQLTEDGFELHLGTNLFGYYALTGLLLAPLQKTPNSRVVTVSSRMNTDAKINWDDLMSEQSYDRFASYSQSKLATILFAFELARRLAAAGSSIKSIAVHPGLAKTGWADNNLSGFMKIMGKLMAALSYQSAEMGALPLLYAATAETVRSGGYYGPDNDTKGYPTEVQPGDNALNEENAKRLWELSEELTDVGFKL